MLSKVHLMTREEGEMASEDKNTGANAAFAHLHAHAHEFQQPPPTDTEHGNNILLSFYVKMQIHSEKLQPGLGESSLRHPTDSREYDLQGNIM